MKAEVNYVTQNTAAVKIVNDDALRFEDEISWSLVVVRDDPHMLPTATVIKRDADGNELARKDVVI